VGWPFEEAAGAIMALAEAGFVVLGLDVRRQNDQFTQETASTAFELPALITRRTFAPVVMRRLKRWHART
jgi:hypothetical protein